MKRAIAIAALLVLVAGIAHAGPYVRLYGVLTFFNQTVDNARGTITLTGQPYATTTTSDSSVVAVGQIIVTTDTAGYFAATVLASDSLTKATTYSIKFEHPIFQAAGIKFQIDNLYIPGGDSISLYKALEQ